MTEDSPQQRRSSRNRVQVAHYDDGDESDSDKETAKRRQTARVVPLQQKMENTLYDGMMDKEASLETLASDWIQEYEKDALPALTTLVNLVLKCSGCEIPIEQHDVEEIGTANEAIGQVQEAARNHIPAEYPLVSKQKEYRGLRKQMLLFFEHLIVNGGERGTIYRDPDFLKPIITWVNQISAARLRAFRHTATVISLFIMRVFCDLQEQEIDMRNKHQAALNKKKVTKAASKVAKQGVTEASTRLELLNEWVSETFQVVYANRCKDVDEKIRTECIETLGVLLQSHTHKFMDNTYLKHFSSAMNDRAHMVRLACLKGLKQVYNTIDVSMLPLRRFTERYQSRIIDIAEMDVDDHVRRQAVELLAILQEKEVLTEDNIGRVIELIMDRDAHVRQEAAKFLVQRVSDENYSTEFGDLDEEEVASLGEAYPDDLRTCFIQFKRAATELDNLEKQSSDEHSSSKPSAVLTALKTDTATLPSRNALAGEALLRNGRKSLGWRWIDLADQLTTDFSALKVPSDSRKSRFSQYVAAFEPSEDEKLIMYEMLQGFVTDALKYAAEPRRGGKRREPMEIESSLSDLYNQLIDKLPQLLDIARYSTSLTASCLQISSLIKPSVYQQQEREEDEMKALKAWIRQFSNQNDHEVLLACRELFYQALDPIEPFRDSAKAEMQSMLDELSYDLRYKLAQEEIDFGALHDSVTKLYHLSFAVDVRDMLETDLVDTDVWLGTKLCDSLSQDGIEQDYAIMAAEILRCYVVWKVGGYVTGEGSIKEQAEETPEYDLALIQNVISQLKIMSVFPAGEKGMSQTARRQLICDQNNQYQTVFKTALLEVLSTVALAAKHPNLSEYGHNVLDALNTGLSEETCKEIMMLYLEKEEAWALAAGVLIQESNLDQEVQQGEGVFAERDENDDNDDEIPEEDDNDDGQVNRPEKDETELDADLCRLTAKVNFAGACGVLDAKYAARLKFNAKSMSPQYNKVLNAIVADNAASNKRKMRTK